MSILSRPKRSEGRIEGCVFAANRCLSRTPFDKLRTGFDTLRYSGCYRCNRLDISTGVH
jgi:hypothetical protein